MATNPKLASLLTNLLHSSMAKPHPVLGWKAGAPMTNFIESLEKIGVDFSKVDLSGIE